MSRFTVVIRATRAQADNVCAQIRKLVDVLGAFVYTDDLIFYQEIALYKVDAKAFSNGISVEDFAVKNGARVVESTADHILIEKTGKKAETHDLYEKLAPFGLLEFARSGRVALSKSKRKTEAYIKELEESKSNQLSIKNY
jgi:acetolactate synthase-1/3 small subunit